MSDPLFRDTLVRIDKDDELVTLTKEIVRQLHECNAVMTIRADGVDVAADSFAALPSFDTAEFTFEYYRYETFELYEQLIEKCGKRGKEFGAIESCSAYFNVAINTWGDVKEQVLDLTSNQDEWGTELDLKAIIMLHIDDLCELLSCEPEVLRDMLFDEGGAVLPALFGEELTEELFGDETEPDDFDLGADAGLVITELSSEEPESLGVNYFGLFEGPERFKTTDVDGEVVVFTADDMLTEDGHGIIHNPPERIARDEAYLTFYPDCSLFRGTNLEGLTAYKKAFERAAQTLSTRNGSITLLWEDELDEHPGINVFLAADGFKKLTFKTSPNYWGDFEAVSYEL